MPLMGEVREVGMTLGRPDHHMTAPSPIAAVGPAPGAYFSRRKLMQPSPPAPPQT